MKIKVNNVGFGEFIQIIENRKTLLVVDCKKLKNKKLPRVNQVLLTHFHADHYSGFVGNLKNRTVYLPSLSPKIASIILCSNLILCLVKRTKAKQAPKISFLCELAKHYDNNGVKFLERGKQIKLNGGKYAIDVLWPCPKYFNFARNNVLKLDNLFKEVFGLLKNARNTQNYLDMINKIKANIIESNDYLKCIRNNEHILRQIIDFKGIEIKENATNKKITTFNQFLRLNENAVSIVLKGEIYNKKFLLTGDIPKEIQKYLYCLKCCNGRFLSYNDEYDFVVIPHHGTGKYFDSNIIPKSKMYAISNGRYVNRRVSQNIYKLNQNSIVQCTNGCRSGCAYYPRKGKNFPNHKCQKGDVAVIL